MGKEMTVSLTNHPSVRKIQKILCSEYVFSINPDILTYYLEADFCTNISPSLKYECTTANVYFNKYTYTY